VEEDYWAEFGSLYCAYCDKLILAAHRSSGPAWDLDYCTRTFENVLANVGNDYVELAMMTVVDEPDRRGEWLERSLKHCAATRSRVAWTPSVAARTTPR
jgi:hypothetical protein